MRKLVVGLLGLKLRGKTPADAAARRVVSGRAWDEFYRRDYRIPDETAAAREIP